MLLCFKYTLCSIL